MPIYRGVGGANREIKQIFRGVNGVNRPINQIYRGVNGVNRKVFQLTYKWLADDSKKGATGELQLNIPSSESNPTILEVGGILPEQKDTPEVSITYEPFFLNATDTVKIDWSYERDTEYHAWIEFYVGNLVLPYEEYSNYAFSRKIDTFSNMTGIFSIKMIKRHITNKDIWGKLTIYNIWLNDVKIL